MRKIEEIVMLLLNEESGYLEQVAGWNLSCLLAGAALADLALEYRVDTDMESLSLSDATPLGDNILDPLLKKIADDPEPRSTEYWVEKIAGMSDEILEGVFERMTESGILKHASGGFWSLSRSAVSSDARVAVRQRIIETIVKPDIPLPEDAIIVGLANACDAFRFLLEPEDFEAQRDRIEQVSKLDLIGQSVAAAVAATSVRRSIGIATRPIPSVSLLKVLREKACWQGNIPRLLASLYRQHGAVCAVRHPITGKKAVILAGNDANVWVNRHGRLYLRAKDYIAGLEGVFGAARSLSSMDGAEHYRLRKVMQPAVSRQRLDERLGEVLWEIRRVLDTWNEGDVLVVLDASRRLMSGQTGQLAASLDVSGQMGSVLKYKNRALITHVQASLPKFMLRTPEMTACRRVVEDVFSNIRNSHTAAQREGKPRDLIDELLGLHTSDPQFFPEADVKFAVTMALITASYMANALAFALCEMASNPDIYRRVRQEADALFADGDPGPEDFKGDAVDVTRRVVLETLRLYPTVPVHLRNVMNGCVVGGYELPVGMRVVVASAAVHYLEENYTDPLRFDIDRYLPGREEHRKRGAFAAFGLGTHTCLASRLVEHQLAINLLMVARHVDLEVPPSSHPIRMNPFPVNAPRKSMKFRVKAKRTVI